MFKSKNRVTVLITLFVMCMVVLALIISRATYAYLAPKETPTMTNSSSITASGDSLLFANGTPFSMNASVANFDYSAGSLISTTTSQARLIGGEDNIESTGEATASYDIKLNVTGNTFVYSNTNTYPEILLQLFVDNVEVTDIDLDSLTYKTVTDRDNNTQKGFDLTAITTGNYTLLDDYQISTTSSTTGTTHNWTFKLIFVNYEFDQSANEDASMDLAITLDY